MGNVDMDNPISGNTNDLGSYSSLAISTATSSKTPASFVSIYYLTIRASLLSPFGQVDRWCDGLCGCRELHCWVFQFVRPGLLRLVDFGVLEWGMICAPTTMLIGGNKELGALDFP